MSLWASSPGHSGGEVGKGRRAGNQGFCQKGVQLSYGHPFLKEIEGKLTLSLIIFWENMPSGQPVFNVWLKACLQLRLWEINSTSNSPVAPHRLRCQISTNQHFASTFLTQGRKCRYKLSFLFLPHCQSAPQRACLQAKF